MLDFSILEYQPAGGMVIADAELIDEIAKQGVRGTIRKTGLSQHTIEAVQRGQPVRRATLQWVLEGLG
ncbi:MAG: hypothetical protein ABI833_18655 [Acidobacteriota bacterium]